MKNPYLLKVNEKYDFEIQARDLKKLDKIQTAENQYHLLKNDQSFRVTVLKADFDQKSFHLLVNDRSYHITIQDEFDQLVARLGLSKSSVQQVNRVTAPMPGLVLEVAVKAGQEVEKGDALLILEAMKMENVIKSAGAGIVKAIHIEKGKAVEKGELLVEME